MRLLTNNTDQCMVQCIQDAKQTWIAWTLNENVSLNATGNDVTSIAYENATVVWNGIACVIANVTTACVVTLIWTSNAVSPTLDAQILAFTRYRQT